MLELRSGLLSLLFPKLFQVGEQFFFAGPSQKVPTQHLVRPQVWLALGPDVDQHARDQRTVGLNGDAVRCGTKQVLTTQHVLEKPEVDLRLPAIMPPKRVTF